MDQELSTCSWDAANPVVFDRCLFALACALMMKFCDKVRLPAFNVEKWTMHVAALQNADEMQNLQCFSSCRFSGSVVKMLTVLSFFSAGPFAHSCCKLTL